MDQARHNAGDARAVRRSGSSRSGETAKRENSQAEKTADGPGNTLPEWGGVERMLRSILTWKAGQFQVSNLGEKVVEKDAVMIVLHEDMAGERSGAGPDTPVSLQALDHFPREIRIAVQSAHGDAHLSLSPLPFEDHMLRKRNGGSSGWWRPITPDFFGKWRQRSDAVEQGGFACRLGIEQEQDVSSEGAGPDRVDAVQLAEMGFEPAFTHARPRR
jgi:hypothetical protein